MFSVEKEFEFAAAHHLTKYKGKCEQIHGHNYKLIVRVTGELDHEDMVMDFNDVRKIVQKHIIDKLDHVDLNEKFDNPSCELLAKWIFDELKPHLPVDQVQLWETNRSSVIYNEK